MGYVTDQIRRADTYASLLRRFRERAGLSQRALARATNLNPAFVHRSEEGTRPPRDAAEVLRVGAALGLGRGDLDQLLEAAGYWPSAFLALGPRDPTLGALVAVLSDARLAEESRRAFRRGVEALARAMAAQADTERPA